MKFGPAIAANVRSCRVQPSGIWHLEEIFVRIGGKKPYFWRAVDDKGEVLEILAQSRRNKWAALKLMRKLRKDRDTFPIRLSPTNWAPILRHFGNLAWHTFTSRAVD